MKNQYFGDVNDYVKFGLLRALGRGRRAGPGIVWMLTPDDDRADGSRIGFLKQARWRRHDPELFDGLSLLFEERRKRSVEWLRRRRLVWGAVTIESEVPHDPPARRRWLRRALKSLTECPLLFFDPDNGFEIASVPSGGPQSTKYLYWEEARTAWDSGHSLLVYQHYPRRNRAMFEQEIADRATAWLPGSRIHVFRSAHVLFLLAAQPSHTTWLTRAAAGVPKRWRGVLTATHPACASVGGEARRNRAEKTGRP